MVIVIDGDEGRVTIEAAPAEAVNTHIGRADARCTKNDADKRNISVVSQA